MHENPVAQPNESPQGVERGRLKILGFDDAEMEFQLMRALGVANYGGGSVGELLWAAAEIRDRMASAPERLPTDIWVGVHRQMAQRVWDRAQDDLAEGRKASARAGFLRASMYFRAAEYFCDPYTGEHRTLGMASRNAFVQAAGLIDFLIEIAEIPFGDASIPVYFLQPDGVMEPRKTLIVNTGFDGSGEELYFQTGVDALRYGYNVLLLDGPGQTGMTRLHPEVKFRPDWETPIRAVVDWLALRPEVDMERLGLYGISLGGYFAARAACHEPRIRALAVNSPIIDLKAYQMGFFPPDAVDNPPELKLEWFPEISRSELPDHLRALLKIAFFRFGCDSLHGWLHTLEAFKIGDALNQLDIPCLSMVGEAEGGEPLRQAKEFVSRVPGPITERVFTFEEGADTHCQLNNLPLSNAVLLDWMDEQLDD